jgi:hypothetical protein
MKTFKSAKSAASACAATPGGFEKNRVVVTRKLGFYGDVFIVVSREQWPTGAPDYIS